MSFLNSRPFRNHVHNQTGFEIPFINKIGFLYLGVSEMNLTIELTKVSTRVEGSASIRAARKANI